MAPNTKVYNEQTVTTARLFSRDEVLEFNGKLGKPMWCIIKKSVYDLTPYLNEHPGGFEMIEEVAGKDATKAFNDFGHSSYAKKLLESLKIGDLNEEEVKTKKIVPPTQKDQNKPIDVNNNENSRQDKGSCHFFMSKITCGIF